MQPPRELDAFDDRNALTPIKRAPAEPLWLPEDTNAILELLYEETLLCPGCGLPRDETMDKEADGQFRARAQRCHACAARGRKAAEFSGPRDSVGLFIGVERV